LHEKINIKINTTERTVLTKNSPKKNIFSLYGVYCNFKVGTWKILKGSEINS
jgi:hypothetical protein